MLLGLSVTPGPRSEHASPSQTDRRIDGAPAATTPVDDLAVRAPRYVAARDATTATFVRSAKVYMGRLWLGTFNDGIFESDAAIAAVIADPTALSRTRHVQAPFRMVNDMLEVRGALYVAANEGLFVTRDGREFARVRGVNVRGVTALSANRHTLYATSASALWALRLDKTGPLVAKWWMPAGSRSLQGVVADDRGAWLASEDRGVIRFDGAKFTAYDRLAGLPTSWVEAVASDGRGGAFAATLRHGALHVEADGKWQRLQGLPSEWTLSVARADGKVCVGTQAGAACYDDTSPARYPSDRLGGLPDMRVHTMVAINGGFVVGTEGGAAVY
jgi:ligand-binding sensor domain-containing protein